MVKKHLATSVVLCFLLSSLSFARVPSSLSPGAVRKGIEGGGPSFPQPKGQSPMEVIEGRIAPEKAKVKQGIKIFVREFRFEGNKVLSTSFLHQLVKDYENRALTFSQLQEICKKIQAVYRKKGYFLAQVFIPPQVVKSGIVIIKIIEGKLGKVEIKGAKHYHASFIKGHFAVTDEGVLNYNKLIKALLLLNEYPDLNVHATLKAGEKPGTTDVILKVKDRRPFHFSMDFNDYGDSYEGRHRMMNTLFCGNVLLQGDLLQIKGVLSMPAKQMQYVDVDYSFPINKYSTRFGVRYSYLNYKVGKELTFLDLRGKSEIFSLYLDHPAYRSLASSLNLGLSFDYKRIRDYMLGIKMSDDELRVFRTFVSWDHLDRWGGRNFLSLEGSWGIPDILGGSRSRDPRASRRDAGGKFFKIFLAAERLQPMPWQTVLVLKGSAQLAAQNLPVDEQFAIGGEYSVRGFESASYLGDAGYRGSVEWHFPPPLFFKELPCPYKRGKKLKDVLNFLAFFDYGRVILRDPLPGEYKNIGIAGVGLGARIELPWGFRGKVDVGFPVGGVRPSKRSAEGNRYRIYVEVSKAFF